MKPSVIHLNVPAIKKARWVRASRAAGVKLTDYIANAVECYMKSQLLQIQIPDSIKFEDLALHMESDGSISFNTDVVNAICRASGVDIRVFEDGPEDNLSELINTWYCSHVENGGSKNPVMESMISEAKTENKLGNGFSYPAGRA
jgi:hypothetical protein